MERNQFILKILSENLIIVECLSWSEKDWKSFAADKVPYFKKNKCYN